MTVPSPIEPHELDHVGRILEQWHHERPDLDVSPLGIIGRLHRLAVELDDRLRVVFAEAGLGDGEFDVLATLRRSGTPYELTPGELMAQTMVSSGAVTKRTDRLVAAGLVERAVSSTEARSRRIRLTASGLETIDDLFARHVANEHRLLSGLTPPQREALSHMLESWVRALG